MGRPQIHQSNADRQRAYRQKKRNATALQNISVSRPPIRYYGGKWRLGNWITAQFPPHTCYVDAFAGGASVLLQKPAATHEVMNDLNGDVVNFFQVLRRHTEQFIREVELTPYSRLEHRLAHQPTDDPLERARRFYIRCWQSFGSGVGQSMTGWRFVIGRDGSDTTPISTWNQVEHLWEAAARLKLVQIECDDALKVLSRFDAPGTLFYLDPPYVHSTRNDRNVKGKGYAHEMSDDDHRVLAERARQLAGMVIVSGYPSPLYDELFAGWERIDCQTMNVQSTEQTECLWLSPSVSEYHRGIKKMPLFAELS